MPERMSGRLVLQRAFRMQGIAGGGIFRVPIKRGAVGEDDFVVVTHVEAKMRVIERRTRSDTHEFRRPDLDDGHARIILKVRNDMIGHCQNPKRWSGCGGRLSASLEPRGPY